MEVVIALLILAAIVVVGMRLHKGRKDSTLPPTHDTGDELPPRNDLR